MQPPTPPAAKLRCPAPATEPVEAEPLPPTGISARALHDSLTARFGPAGDALFKWFSVDEPVWGRNLALRLDTVAADCRQDEAVK